jgi:diguanylate cyclase (GGDEF)-like protein
VARILEENTRDGDCTARLGGDEFMVLALDLELPQTLEVGERLRAAVEKAKMPQSVRGVTVSVGIAATQLLRVDQGCNLMEAADRALYAAKTSGRNCVRTAG